MATTYYCTQADDQVRNEEDATNTRVPDRATEEEQLIRADKAIDDTEPANAEDNVISEPPSRQRQPPERFGYFDPPNLTTSNLTSYPLATITAKLSLTTLLSAMPKY